MTTLHNDILAAMLGRLYGTFEPINPHAKPGAEWAWQHRLAYTGRHGWNRTAGLLPRPTFGGNPAERKQEQRAFLDLEGAGLVVIQKKMAGLTEKGLREAQQITKQITAEDALPGIDYILSKLGGPDEWIDVAGNGRLLASGYVSEATLGGFDAMPSGKVGGNRCSCWWTVDAVMPLLVSGLVDFDHQPDFELPLYTLTDEGAALAKKRKKGGQADPSAWLNLRRKTEKEPGAAFFNEWRLTVREMERAKPVSPNVIQHHLSACIWPRHLLDGDGEP